MTTKQQYCFSSFYKRERVQIVWAHHRFGINNHFCRIERLFNFYPKLIVAYVKY